MTTRGRGKAHHLKMISLYALSLIGDLNYTIVLTGSIIYGQILGGSSSQTGVIGGAYGITYLIFSIVFGRLGDRIGRFKSILISLIGMIATASFYLYLAKTIIFLIIGQIIFGVFYGLYWPNIEAFISENSGVNISNHQRGMANFCVSWSIGFMLGPYIGGFFSDFNIFMAFEITLVIYMIALIIALIGLPHQDITKKEENAPETEEKPSKSISGIENNVAPVTTAELEIFDSKVIKLNTIRLLLGTLAYSFVVKLLISYFTDYAIRPVVGLEWTGELTGRTMMFLGIGRTLYYILARLFGTRYFKSSYNRINLAYLIHGTIILLIIFIRNSYLISLLLFIFGIFSGLVYLSSLDLIIFYNQETKGEMAGLFESSIGVGTILSPIIAGILGGINSRLPFLVFGLFILTIFVFNSLILIYLGRTKQN
ncbi:MAG: MFS transporter [Promethearchaeota archaeon]